MGAAAEDYAPLLLFGMHPVSSENLDELDPLHCANYYSPFLMTHG